MLQMSVCEAEILVGLTTNHHNNKIETSNFQNCWILGEDFIEELCFEVEFTREVLQSGKKVIG